MSSNTKAFEEKMKSSVEHLDRELAAVRAGRANPAVLDKVSVDYYGAPTPIQQVASVAVSEARTLTITPWDRTLLRAITKAIMASDVGITPIDDGSTIRLNFPAPTEERRKQLAKEVAKLGEEAKVAVRNVRRDAMDKAKAMKKAGAKIRGMTYGSFHSHTGKMGFDRPFASFKGVHLACRIVCSRRLMGTPVIQNLRHMYHLSGLLHAAENKVIILGTIEFRAKSAYCLYQAAPCHKKMADIIVGTKQVNIKIRLQMGLKVLIQFCCDLILVCVNHICIFVVV